MRSLCSPSAVLTVLLVSAFARPVLADAKACAAAAELGQRARAAGKLRRARASFLACAADECPALVRTDCQDWASDVSETLPSIIVDARDATEHDVGDVRVTMDGELLARNVDGTAIPVDPGPHTFLFERAASAPVTEKVIIKERAKGRTFVVRFAAASMTASESPVAAESDQPRRHTVLPWILIGVGGAFVVTGAVLLVSAPRVPPNCDESSGSCRATSGESADTLARDRSQAGESIGRRSAGTISIIAGAGLAGAGLLWHFLEPTGPRRSAQPTIVPWSTGNAGGIAALGSF
jgi:hypothetical protein